ncbi:Uncharacterized protein TSPI_04596 [Trichinella spiralis]|uniref:Uncharacterized protein n=1 Tax=Trichinella spiralis TaxID=6334 RepID=A0ABR3K3V3_TRISP
MAVDVKKTAFQLIPGNVPREAQQLLVVGLRLLHFICQFDHHYTSVPLPQVLVSRVTYYICVWCAMKCMVSMIFET